MARRSVGSSALVAGFVAFAAMFCGAGCADPARVDRALAEVEAARREAAVRDGEMRVLGERQAVLAQQLQMVTTLATSALARDPRRDEELNRRLTELNERITHVDVVLSKLREDELPKDVDLAAARRLAEQGSPEDRATAVRKVQALLDAGLVKVTVRNGRAELAILRPLDAKNPYQPAKPEPAPGPTKKTSLTDDAAKKGKQEIERDLLEFR